MNKIRLTAADIGKRVRLRVWVVEFRRVEYTKGEAPK